MSWSGSQGLKCEEADQCSYFLLMRMYTTEFQSVMIALMECVKKKTSDVVEQKDNNIYHYTDSEVALKALDSTEFSSKLVVNFRITSRLWGGGGGFSIVILSWMYWDQIADKVVNKASAGNS